MPEPFQLNTNSVVAVLSTFVVEYGHILTLNFIWYEALTEMYLKFYSGLESEEEIHDRLQHPFAVELEQEVVGREGEEFSDP